MLLEIIAIIGLLIFSLLDVRFKAIPSVLLTSLLFVVAFVNIQNLGIAVLLFIFAFLLYDFNYFNGKADIKTMVIIGFLINSLGWLILFITIFMVIGLIYTVFMRKILKEKREIPFVPAIFLSYMIFYGVTLI